MEQRVKQEDSGLGAGKVSQRILGLPLAAVELLQRYTTSQKKGIGDVCLVEILKRIRDHICIYLP